MMRTEDATCGEVFKEITEFDRAHAQRRFYMEHIETLCGHIARCRSKAFKMFSAAEQRAVESVAVSEFWDMVEAVNRFQRAERDLVECVTDANAHGLRIVVQGDSSRHPKMVFERDEDGNNIDMIDIELSTNKERADASSRWDKWRPEGSE